jgi:hypothetical protein
LRPTEIDPKPLFENLDPLAYAATQHGAMAMLVGAQDEFFSLDQVVRTFEAIRAPAKWLSVVADYDHGWYFGTGCPAACMPAGSGWRQESASRASEQCKAFACPRSCPAGARPPYCGPHGSYNRSHEFNVRRAMLLRALLARVATDSSSQGAAFPGRPEVLRGADETVVKIADGAPAPRVVRIAISANGGYTFGQYTMDRASDGNWHFRHSVPPNAIVFAESESATGVTVTSVPQLPPTYKPRARPYQPIKETAERR